mmetsp:Transcript_321/g.537  ORF Transcript_321/g.537 Transcript_321/m.537 type:complete len:290 (-) Transcript_321:1995-2864(-)
MVPPHHSNKESFSACGVCGESNHRAKYKCPRCRLPYCSVKCCKDHKVSCDPTQRNIGVDTNVKDSNNCSRAISKYVAADELTRDPLLNSVIRKQMLRENEDEPEDEGWRITQEMMENIDKNEWLRKELADGGLRQIIAQIDNADDVSLHENIAWQRHGQHGKRKRLLGGSGNDYDPSPRELELMKARRLNPNFNNFIDRLLLIAGVLVESDKTTIEQEVATYLHAHGDGEETPSVTGILSLAPIIKKKAANIETILPDILKDDASFSESSHEDDESISSASSASSACST